MVVTASGSSFTRGPWPVEASFETGAQGFSAAYPVGEAQPNNKSGALLKPDKSCGGAEDAWAERLTRPHSRHRIYWRKKDRSRQWTRRTDASANGETHKDLQRRKPLLRRGDGTSSCITSSGSRSVGIVMRHVGVGQSGSSGADAGADAQAQRALKKELKGQ